MSAIGSLVFCTDCGNLLDASTGKANVILVCQVCGAHNRDTSAKTVVTHSRPDAFPSSLRAKRSEVQAITDADMQRTKARIKQTCEKCGAEEVSYHERQLRGADEGTTIFYECDCGHAWNTNN